MWTILVVIVVCFMLSGYYTNRQIAKFSKTQILAICNETDRATGVLASRIDKLQRRMIVLEARGAGLPEWKMPDWAKDEKGGDDLDEVDRLLHNDIAELNAQLKSDAGFRKKWMDDALKDFENRIIALEKATS